MATRSTVRKERRCGRRLLRAVATLVLPGAAAAQSVDYASLEQLFGESVTTSVTGSPQRESEVPATMVIVTAEEIRRSGARDIPGVLRHVAGLEVLQTSNDHADVGVRGYNQAFSPRLLVLVDGRQVYADYYGFTPWSTVPIELDAIRQIEIVKGPNSALFGFNAVGGVINIVTYDALHEAVNAASFAGGSQELAQATLVSTFKVGDSTGLRLSAGTRSGEDFETPQRPVEVGTRRGNERSAVSLAGAHAFDDNIELRVEATYSDAGQTEFSPIYAHSYGAYQTRSLKSEVTADTGIGLVQGVVYRNEIKADIYSGSSSVSFLNFDNEVTIARLQTISKIQLLGRYLRKRGQDALAELTFAGEHGDRAGRVDADPAVQHAVGGEAAGKIGTRRLLGEDCRHAPAEGDGDAADGLEKVAALGIHGVTIPAPRLMPPPLLRVAPRG